MKHLTEISKRDSSMVNIIPNKFEVAHSILSERDRKECTETYLKRNNGN